MQQHLLQNTRENYSILSRGEISNQYHIVFRLISTLNEQITKIRSHFNLHPFVMNSCKNMSITSKIKMFN